MAIINAEEYGFFLREGYLVLNSFFAEGDLQPLIDEISDEIDRHATVLKCRGELSRTYEEEPFEKRLAAIHAETRRVYDAIKAGNLCGPSVFGLITHPKLLDLAEHLCGPELVASSVYRIRPKLPNDSGGCVPWHQDSGYFEPHCDNSLIVTVWIPLVDATPDRGCLWLIPRSHALGIRKHSPHGGKVFLEIRDDDLPPGEPVCVPVRKGGILLMTNMTAHGSPELNTSGIIRWSIDIRYQSANVPTNAFLGEIQAALEFSSSASPLPACYPPEQDFLVRSASRPQLVCTSADEFRALRKCERTTSMTDRWDLRSAGEDGWRGFSETYTANKSS